MKDDHLTLRLPAALARALARLARARGLPRSQLVREAIAGYVGARELRRSPIATSRSRTAREVAAAWSPSRGSLPTMRTPSSATSPSSRETAALPDEHWE